MKIGTKKGEIYNLLLNHERLRDDDNILIAAIWEDEIFICSKNAPKVHTILGLDMLDYLRMGLLTNPESIRRSRAKLQQENPELRGDKYKARHKEQINVMQELKNWNNDQKK